MKRNAKIGFFFLSMALVVVLSIVISAATKEEQTRTIQEILDLQSIYSEEDVEIITNDLLTAGYDLNEPYTYGEIIGIASAMAKNKGLYEADWVGILINVLANTGNTLEPDDQIPFNSDSEIPVGACSDTDQGVIWDSHPTDQCANSCPNINECHACCVSSSNYDKYEKQWCSRACGEKFTKL